MRHPALFLLALSISFCCQAESPAPEYNSLARESFPMELLWGDTHVHSSFSMDANSAGNTRLSPAEAYRFAKGEVIGATNGQQARLATPLDFLVVSDHAEYMGLLPKLREADEKLLADPVAKELSELIKGNLEDLQQALIRMITSLARNEPIIDNDDLKQSIWADITRLADEANEPGHFSALIGYEWTSMPGGDNLHRVVVYADGADKAAQMVPVSAFDGDRPEDLWAFMERYETQTGGGILAIPHNGNVSNGKMFLPKDSQGRIFGESYAETRARFEPLVEVTQIKGDGETHPLLSPDDEFADFGTWDKGNLQVGATVPKTDDMLQYEYARRALLNGLAEEARLGINPFKFGMIGSTDSHTSLATAAEDNFWGKAVGTEPGDDRVERVFFQSAGDSSYNTMAWQQVSSGYAAVWATENTREAIFAAMKRKEVYATTGSRLAVRFFGGWNFEAADLYRPDYARIGYRKGVPMGGTLPPKQSPAPGFMVVARKDPNGANLDRIQVIKGWRDADGKLKETVYNVAVSNGRKINRNGEVKPLKSTVNINEANYTNTTGAAQLTAYWQDPDFDPAEHAFYYARVLEIATPRWTTYEAKRFNKTYASDIPTEVQDRAYTSPIWYTP